MKTIVKDSQEYRRLYDGWVCCKHCGVYFGFHSSKNYACPVLYGDGFHPNMFFEERGNYIVGEEVI